ncbi:hypothetical protein ACWGDS_43225 [Streptomyces sp. NPDC055059]|jgi:hypothetical protein|uniref:hypothetical protein n=1 Tax=Streptomyces sp. NPDC127172 TaxID=3345382 RepID=UPI0036457A3E
MKQAPIHVAEGFVRSKESVPDAALSDVLPRVARTTPGFVDVTAQFDVEVP